MHNNNSDLINSTMDQVQDTVQDTTQNISSLTKTTITSAVNNLDQKMDATMDKVVNSMPTMPSLDNSNSSPTGMITDSKTLKMFSSLSFWTKFYGVIGYIGFGFFALITVFVLFSIPFNPVGGIITFILFALLSVLYFYIAQKIYSFGSEVKETKNSKTQDEYNQNSLLAFQQIQKYFKTIGIIFIAYIGLLLSIIPLALIFGASVASVCANPKPEMVAFCASTKAGDSDFMMEGGYNGMNKGMDMNKNYPTSGDININTPEGSMKANINGKDINLDISGVNEGKVQVNIPSNPNSNPAINAPATNMPTINQQ